MITEQLEFFPIKIKKTSSVIVRQSNSVYFREWNDIVASIAKNFSVADRKYYAGMIDGDGSFNFRIPKDAKNFKATMSLELRYDHAEPVTKLAELFDKGSKSKANCVSSSFDLLILIIKFSFLKVRLVPT